MKDFLKKYWWAVLLLLLAAAYYFCCYKPGKSIKEVFTAGSGKDNAEEETVPGDELDTDEPPTR